MWIHVGILSIFAMTAINAADLCAGGNGGCQQNCTTVNGTKTVCSCMPGWELNHDLRTCHDTDLCKIKNGGCEQFCQSHHTFVTCSCKVGYEPLPSNDRKCGYINLCATLNGGCEQICASINGTIRTCSCRPPFALDDNNKACYNTDLCATNKGGCAHDCENIRKGVVCSCSPGFMVDPSNGMNCIDIKLYVPAVKRYLLSQADECASNNGGCDHICTNTIDSYKCSCRSGYELGDNLKTCKKWRWEYTLAIILCSIVLIIVLIIIWCLCGKFKFLSENICCKFFISWKCCMSGIFCKCNKEPESDVTDLYFHKVEINIAPIVKAPVTEEHVHLTGGIKDTSDVTSAVDTVVVATHIDAHVDVKVEASIETNGDIKVTL